MQLTPKTLVGNLLFFAVIFLILTRILSVSSGVVTPIDIVSSDSMNPSLMTGDVIAWSPASIHDVKVGDVIVYKSWLHWPDTRLVVHRVVEVHEEFGKVALVTKGDANPYTDQAGPHIPEPNVIADNFVGKALMVGPVPLKIPFVGYVGIWLNQGFTVLSQSASSKGALASVVVFLPLVVSMILLVVALLLMPQRRRTVEEKLRYFILSSRSLNLKKTAVFFFVLLTVFFVIIHVFAFETLTGSVGVGEFASKDSLDLGSLVPGQTGQARQIPVINPSLFPVKGVLIGTGALAPLVHHVVFSVGSGESLTKDVVATVPLGTPDGTYVGEIRLYSSPLWVLFPDAFLSEVSEVNPSFVSVVLDVVSAAMLTGIILLCIIVLAFIEEAVRVWRVDRSWWSTERFFHWRVRERLERFRVRVHEKTLKVSWVSHVNLASFQARPVLVGVLVVAPVFILMDRNIAALIVAAVLAGVVAYACRCKLLEKVVLSTVVSFVISVVVLAGTANILMLSTAHSLLETLGLVTGILGVYLMASGILLLPVVLISWLVTRGFRNVKEHYDPLLVLEGGCDL